MHLEVLVEDQSGAKLLDAVLTKLCGADGTTWRFHAYKGLGKLPDKLQAHSDPAKRILLDQLPRLLRGYAKVPTPDQAVLVVLDLDHAECRILKAELEAIADACHPRPTVLFRFAIEEMEAWLLGDREAIQSAYPNAKAKILDAYRPDTICGTWELLANAIYPGGAKALSAKGYPTIGQVKSEWAERIGPALAPARNRSPSFQGLCKGLRRLLAQPAAAPTSPN